MECLKSKILSFKNVRHNYYYLQPRLFFLGAQEAEPLHPIKADTCVSFIKQCITLRSLKSVHASMHRTHLLDHNIFFLTNLVAHYTYLGCVANAYSLFSDWVSSALSTDVFLWNVMVRGLVDNGQCHLSLQLYHQMLRQQSFWPDNFTFPFVLKACASLGDLEVGVKVHGHVVQFGCESDIFVGNSLIAMYGKCGRVNVSREVFDKMPERNVVSWSSMIGAYAQNGSYEDGLQLFWRMLDEIVIPNRVALLNAMACVHKENEAEHICRVAADNGLILDQSVQNAAMGMFARCGRIDVARRYFDGILGKDLVSWASMIEAYAQFDLPFEALQLFKEMKLKSIATDSVILLSVIRACSNLSSFLQAKIIHAIIARGYWETNLALATALVDLYVKCGSLLYARRVFDRMHERNIISWSTMISGYGMHGHGREALHLFDQMKASLKPDHITFVSLLSACSHGGLISEGWACFNSMVRDFAVTPRPEHYACMVDLLGRAGKLDEAYDFIQKMPMRPDAGVWGALLGACRIHLNVELAEIATKSLFELDVENPGRYVLLSNIYSLSGRRKEAHRIRALMKQRGVKKISGHTIIEIKNKVYIFVSGDRSHPQADLIYLQLEKLMNRIRREGYTPDVNFVLHDVEEETKEKMLYAHSERLAIVFGLLNLRPETTIRIRKNLRVCGDCHTATKYISKVTEREIVVRDAHRFHHFKNGTCSCGDYW